MIEFDWDPQKDLANQKKHGVSFIEAKSVFFDENAVQFLDAKHSSIEEDRFLLLGFSYMSRLLLICHCEVDEDQIIRIISARKATKTEQKEYGW